MGLSIKDMVKGTIVDHTYQYDENERTTELRPVRRRGIIRKVEGAGNDAVSAVWVQFKATEKPEKVAPRELVRVYPWNHKAARRALARLEGRGDTIGAEFEERRAPIRPRVEDGLALTPRKAQAVVEPEEDEVDPMLDSQEPIVIPVKEGEGETG